MKKICMVAYTNYLSDARPRREAETLVRRGDQVDFVALVDDGTAPVEIVNGVRLIRLRQQRYRGSSGYKYAFSYFRFLCAASLRIAGRFRRERYDVVYVHTMPDLLVLAGLIPKLFGARVVLNLHDMMPELYMSKFSINEDHWLIRLLAFQEQCSIRLADRVICVHHPHRDLLVQRGASVKKITVLPNVPDPALLPIASDTPSENRPFRIVYHGTIALRLGLDLAVRAFERVAGSCPDARFEIYGTGDAAAELEAQIANSTVKDRIEFRNEMFRVEAIAEKILGASIGIIPNRRDAATENMLPVKLLEYLQCGIPVAAPRLRVIQHYLSEGQVAYYEPGNVDELAACIRRLYLNPLERKYLAQKGAEFAGNFNWERFKGDLFNVIDADGSYRPTEGNPLAGFGVKEGKRWR